MEASKFDIISAFNGLELVVYHEGSGGSELKVHNLTLRVKDMEKMMVETRPCYPTDKLTFSIADLTRDKTIQFLGLMFYSNHRKYDISVMLEDRQRSDIISLPIQLRERIVLVLPRECCIGTR